MTSTHLALRYALRTLVPAVAACLTAIGPATVLAAPITAGVTRNYEAGVAPDGDNDAQWEDTLGSTTFQFTFTGGAQTPTAQSDPFAPGVANAYAMPAGVANAPAGTTLNETTDSTFELWFRPDALTGNHVLLELGGSGTGTSFTLQGDTLNFITQTGNNNTRMTASTTLPVRSVDRFNQIVGVIDYTGGGAGTIDLYVNGVLADSDAIGAGYTSFAGGNASGLGKTNSTFAGNNVVTGVTDADGSMGIVRIYDDDPLNAAQVGVNYASVSGLELNFEAGNETTGNGVWESTTSNSSFDWDFSGGQTPVSANIQGRPGIDQAYAFPAAVATELSYAGLPGGAGVDLSYEVWFKPDDLDGQHVIFKTGGSGSGTSLVLDGDQLILTAQTGNANRMQVTHTLDAADVSTYGQAVGVIDFTGADEGELHLYLNGSLVGSDTIGSDFTSWAGGAGSGLGRDFGTVAGDNSFTNGGTFTNFDGKIAVHRVYQGVALSDDVVLSNFADVSGLEFGNLGLNWDASDPGAAPTTTWEPNVGSGMNWNLVGGPAPASSITTEHPGLHAAYEFNGAGTANGSTTLDALGVTQQNASFEIWFKPDDLIGLESLFETGGNGAGTVFALDGDQIRFKSQSSGAIQFNTSATLTNISDFIQVVGTIDLATDEIVLYVNGTRVDIDDSGGNHTDWAGNNGNAIGGVNATSPIAGLGSYDGQIALLRFYEGTVLTPTQVRANWQAIAAIPEPGTGLLVLLATAGLAARRRPKRRAE